MRGYPKPAEPGHRNGGLIDAPSTNGAVVGVEYAGPVPGIEHDSGDAAADGEPSEFDPAEHTVADVLEYLAAHPDATDALLAAERSGKNRAGIVGAVEPSTGA